MSPTDAPGPRCPICKATVKPRSENPSFPFCNARCKTIDLGKWMSEEYRIPVEDSFDEEGDGSASSALDPKLGQNEGGPVRH